MSRKNPIEGYFKKSELPLPLNPLTPAEREFMKQKRKRANNVYRKYFPNGKTKEDIKGKEDTR